MRQVSFATITKDKHETDQGNVHSPDPTTKAWPGTMTNLILPYFICTTCINHTPISPTTKTVKAHVCSATSPTAFPRKLEIAPTTLLTIAGNASTAFPANLLSASANLSNHPSSFDGQHPLLPSPKTSSMARATVAMVIERAVNIEAMVTPCSRNKIRIFSAKDVFYQEPFQGFA